MRCYNVLDRLIEVTAQLVHKTTKLVLALEPLAESKRTLSNLENIREKIR